MDLKGQRVSSVSDHTLDRGPITFPGETLLLGKWEKPAKGATLVNRLLMYCSVFFLLSGLAWGAVLENPAPNSLQSGIGVVSGWKCAATRIEVIFDSGAPILVAYGTTRGDTQSACGDSNNGFGLLWNWNLLGAGDHMVRVLDNGVEFARATFTVVSPGGEFLTGLSGEAVSQGFPNQNLDTTLVWQQNLQNFVITRSQPHTGTVCDLFIIDDISNSGRFIELDDRTTWEVDSADRFKVEAGVDGEWLPDDEVSLCALNGNPGGTRVMINLFLFEDNVVQVIRSN